MGRPLTVHEALLRKALPWGATIGNPGYDCWVAYGDGYDAEAIHLTDEEAEVLNDAASLTVCPGCSVVIEDGDQMLTTPLGHRLCEACGEEYLETQSVEHRDRPHTGETDE